MPRKAVTIIDPPQETTNVEEGQEVTAIISPPAFPAASPALEPVMHPSLAAKFRALLSEPIAVAKTGKNASQGYSFRETDVLISTLRPYFAKHGIVPFVTQVPGTREWREIQTRSGSIAAVVADFMVTFVDADTGCGFSLSLPGMGMDSGDKAINKAITVATRYMLQGPTMIATSLADPEADEEPEPPQRPKVPVNITIDQLRDMFADLVEKSKTSERPVDPIKAMAALGVSDLAELPPDRIQKVYLQLKTRLDGLKG